MEYDWLPIGRQISGSKSCPKGHICVFNANVCTKSEGKIWFGDLDITRDADELRKLAKAKGETIYVLRERDARFRNEASPLFENARAIISTDGKLFTDEPISTESAKP